MGKTPSNRALANRTPVPGDTPAAAGRSTARADDEEVEAGAAAPAPATVVAGSEQSTTRAGFSLAATALPAPAGAVSARLGALPGGVGGGAPAGPPCPVPAGSPGTVSTRQKPSARALAWSSAENGK